MPAILELPEVRARVGLLTVGAFEVLAEMGAVSKRSELIRGVIVEKMPKSPLHSTLVRQVFLFLLDFQRDGLVAFTERSLRLADSMPEPDAMVVRGEERDFRRKHPTSAELVVEIAVSSVALDRENASLYAEANIPEYWIVLGEKQQIEVYRQPVGGVYQQRKSYEVGETLACESIPGLRVAVKDWFVEDEED